MRLLLLTAAPAALVLAPLRGAAALGLSPWWAVAAAPLVAVLAAVTYRPERFVPRLLATAATAFWVGLMLIENAHAPTRGLFVLTAAILLLSQVWPSTRIDRFDAAHPKEQVPDVDLLAAAVLALVVVFDVVRGDPPSDPVRPLALAAMLLVLVSEVWRRYRGWRWWDRWATAVALAFALVPGLVPVLPLLGGPRLPLSPGGVVPLIVLVLVTHRFIVASIQTPRQPHEPTFLDVLLNQPARALVLSFLLLCALGTVLLELPAATSTGEALRWIDSAFTAVSATCVTGLIVLDTPVDFSGLGQFIILGLIQVGGLGIMVFSAAAFVLLGRRLSLSHERAVADVVGAEGRAGVRRAVREILVVTGITESAAALVLFGCFLAEGDSLPMAAWRAVFTAISAFCNAGFALQSDSLVPYRDNALVLLVVAAAIVVGGLGPAVVAGVATRRRKLTVHMRLVLWTTAILIVVPAAFILAFEWNGTLHGLSLGDRLTNSLFQSVTLRTAGFNSIDLTAIRPATWTLMVLMMFVGGSPASTAGGVKTTTIAIVVLAVLAVVRGRSEIDVFGRRIAREVVLRAVAITTLGVLGACLGLVALQITQVMPLDAMLFEVVSALGTVGLSVGGTGMLDEVGKLIIIACMFVGRVGPLTLFVFLSAAKSHPERRHPAESILVG